MKRSHDVIRQVAPDRLPGVEHRARLPLLCRLAKTTFTAIEREAGLARGAVSNWNGGRTYAYPRLQEAVVSHLAPLLGRDAEELRDYLFGDPQDSAKPS